MEPSLPYYIIKLNEVLLARQQLNPRYSLRAYSRDLGIHPSSLSQILRGNRSLPSKYSNPIADRLPLKPEEREEFINSICPL